MTREIDMTDTTLTTAMKSVGESMAMGRNFPEALGKAMRAAGRCPDCNRFVAGRWAVGG